MPDPSSIAAVDAHKQGNAAIPLDIELRSVDNTVGTEFSPNATAFDLMGLPPELRLHVYDNVQDTIRTRLPLRGVDIFSLDLDLTLLRTSHQIKCESSSILNHSRLKLPHTILFHVDNDNFNETLDTMSSASQLIRVIIDGPFMSRPDSPVSSTSMALLCASKLQTFAMYLSRHVNASRDAGILDFEEVVIDANFMRSYFHRAISQLQVHKTLAIRILVDMGSGVGFNKPIEFACFFWATMSDVSEVSRDTCQGLRIQVAIVVQLGKAESTRMAMEKSYIRSRFHTSHIEYTIEEVAGELNVLSS